VANPLLPFDPTKPADTDYESVFPALDRTDKTSISKVLGTLAPFGSATTAWRVVQIGNTSYLTQNASWNGSAWVLDDSTAPATAVLLDAVNRRQQMLWAPAGSSPFAAWTLLALFDATANAVNYLQTTAEASGGAPTLLAGGSDPNIGINLVTKGTGVLSLNNQAFGAALVSGNGYIHLGPITLQWGALLVTVSTANAWITAPVTLPAPFSVPTFAVSCTILGEPTIPVYATASSMTTTGFQANVYVGATGTFYDQWIAIGAT
jgi:hypothetical protein